MRIDPDVIQALGAKLGLSPREGEVLWLLFQGVESNAQIAQTLGIGVGTAKMHVHNLLLKTHCKTKHVLLARCLQLL